MIKIKMFHEVFGSWPHLEREESSSVQHVWQSSGTVLDTWSQVKEAKVFGHPTVISLIHHNRGVKCMTLYLIMYSVIWIYVHLEMGNLELSWLSYHLESFPSLLGHKIYSASPPEIKFCGRGPEREIRWALQI